MRRKLHRASFDKGISAHEARYASAARGIGLKHIDRFVQIEGAFREQDRARFGPSLEAF